LWHTHVVLAASWVSTLAGWQGISALTGPDKRQMHVPPSLGWPHNTTTPSHATPSPQNPLFPSTPPHSTYLQQPAKAVEDRIREQAALLQRYSA
jgi:hypothetical protein